MAKKVTGRNLLCIILAVLAVCLSGCAGQNGDAITDIRMTVQPASPGHPDQEDGTTFLRIYYGICRNGQWQDRPSEQYDLKAIFRSRSAEGYQAAGRSHLVKIGPYLLVCISNYSLDDDPETTVVCTISDTLGTPVQEPFLQYSSTSASNPAGHQYGYLKQEGLGKVQTESFFMHYYFLVLDYENLPEDYVLECRTSTAAETVTQTLTYGDIMQLLGS